VKHVAIIGHGRDKFGPESARVACHVIADIFRDHGPHNLVLVSGRSPRGGVDVWAEDMAEILGLRTDIKAPKTMSWSGPGGYRDRNLDIAQTADVVHVIVVDTYPDGYEGQRFKICYHCKTTDHVKSGACWTAKQAKKLGKEIVQHIIKQGGANG